MIAKVHITSNPDHIFGLAVTKEIAEALGWKEGDEVSFEVPAYRYGKCDHLIIEKVEKKD